MKDTTKEHHITMIGRPQQVCLLQLPSYSQHRFPWIYVSTSYFQFNEKQYNFTFYFHFIFNTKQLKFNLKLTNLCRVDVWQLSATIHNVKIRRVNEKNALKCLSHFTYYLLTKYVAEKRDKRLKTAFHFDLKFQMENALFVGLHLQ